MENLVINIGNPRRVELTVLSANGVKVELSRCTDVQLILWINGRSKRALTTQISNDVLISDLSASELSYLGEYSGQVKYTDNGVQQTTERVYLFRVANEFFKSTSGTGVSDTGSLVVSVSTPAAINKGYSAYELAVQNGYVGTEKEWIESLSKDSKDAASVALQSAKNADDKAKEAELAASNANNATVSVTAAKEAAVQAAVSANSAANSANTAKDSANTAAANANDKANLANTAANNADVAKTNAEKATADANTATLSAINAATNANAKAVYANEQGDYAKQQGLNAVATAGEAATNADNAAFAASQQAAYAKQQGDYAKQEAQGIDAKIATKADQSDLVQLEQDVKYISLTDTDVFNNDFESTTGGLQAFAASISSSTDFAKFGSKSAKVSTQSGNEGTSFFVKKDLVVGDKLSFFFWQKSNNLNSSELNVYDSTNYYHIKARTELLTQEWILVYGDFICKNTGTHYIRVYPKLNGVAAIGDTYVDGFVIFLNNKNDTNDIKSFINKSTEYPHIVTCPIKQLPLDSLGDSRIDAISQQTATYNINRLNDKIDSLNYCNIIRCINTPDGILKCHYKAREGRNAFFSFKNWGINNIYNLYSSGYYDNTKNDIIDISTEGVNRLTWGFSSDNIGPVQIKAINNGDGGDAWFSGGTHGWDSETKPTARMISKECFIDGRRVDLSTQFDLYGKECRIVVRNELLAGNTFTLGRYVLNEIVEYIITQGRCTVFVRLVPKEDIFFKLYYGAQVSDSDVFHKIMYINVGDIADNITNTNSGNVSDTYCDSVMLYSSFNDTLIFKVHNDYLGNNEYTGDNPKYFRSGSKLYHNTIRTSIENVAKGKVIAIKWSYDMR